MDYESIIHALIDDLVSNKNGLIIKKLPNEKEDEPITYLICAEDNDIARLIGHKGSVATSLREIISIAGKLNNEKIRLKFESLTSTSENK
ncbi:MAG: KH domain-containing protein [Firmicutes bacterium]|nr:KH domain-containing protein [Candidatus Alectryobacillus merdavium]